MTESVFGQMLEALRMVRDADEDCKKDGLPQIPAPARAAIDRAIATAETSLRGVRFLVMPEDMKVTVNGQPLHRHDLGGGFGLWGAEQPKPVVLTVDERQSIRYALELWVRKDPVAGKAAAAITAKLAEATP